MADGVSILIGDSRNTGLIIDESGFAKQGTMSVVTSRQWLGRLGNIENLLAHLLPRRGTNSEDVIRQMARRHRHRQKTIASHTKRRQLTEGDSLAVK